MSLEEAVVPLHGNTGRLLLSAAMLLITGITGATLHTVFFDHTHQLSGISQKMDDMVASNLERARAEDAHAKSNDEAIDRLVSENTQRAVAIAHAETEIEQLQGQQRQAPRYERESLAEPIAPPNVFSALSHIFAPHRPHRH